MADDVADHWNMMPKRPAREDEVCSCGRPAVKVVFTEDLGPVPSCGTKEVHRPPDCPPWCIQDHRLPHDRTHMSESQQVSLDASPWERVDGTWEAALQPLLVGLTRRPDGKPTYIDIIGTDSQLAAQLTAYEADKLAEILRNFAATLREESLRNDK